MIRDIVLQCDASESCDARLDTAFGFAEKCGAHLQAVFVMPNPVIPSYAEGYSEVIPYNPKDQIERVARQAKEAEEMFREKSVNHKVKTEWRIVEDGDYDTILDLARYADIVLIPQLCARFGNNDKIFIIDRLLIHSGRPLIIIPDLNKRFPMDKNIMIAWDESHEAARAVHDALPILKNAKKIRAISISEKADDEDRFLITGHDLQEHLTHHSIKIGSAFLKRGNAQVGEKLLDAAMEFNADLIIMGAYGHSRLREIILGGATDYILRKATIPVLVSH